MPPVTIQQAQASLSDLIHGLPPGDEVIIMENDQPVARLLSSDQKPPAQRRKLGTLKGTVQYLALDFDAPLEDFKKYME